MGETAHISMEVLQMVICCPFGMFSSLPVPFATIFIYLVGSSLHLCSYFCTSNLYTPDSIRVVLVSLAIWVALVFLRSSLLMVNQM